MDRSFPARRRWRGFTLIELLVALVIMSMLAVMSWRAIDSMNRAQTLTQQRADELLRMQAALGQWNADLNALIDTDELMPLEFDGKLLRLTRRDAAEGAGDSAGVRVVAWTRIARSAGGGQWARWQSGPITRRLELANAWQRAAEWSDAWQEPTTTDDAGAATPAADSRDSVVILAQIDAWQLFYHRGETWGNPLSSVGNEAGGSATSEDDNIPNGVRLVLTLSPGTGISGPISSDWVRPTLKATR